MGLPSDHRGSTVHYLLKLPISFPSHSPCLTLPSDCLSLSVCLRLSFSCPSLCLSICIYLSEYHSLIWVCFFHQPFLSVWIVWLSLSVLVSCRYHSLVSKLVLMTLSGYFTVCVLCWLRFCYSGCLIFLSPCSHISLSAFVYAYEWITFGLIFGVIRLCIPFCQH